MSPVSPRLILPGVCEKRSQIDSPLPSSFQAPSIWYDAVAVPHQKPLGNCGAEACWAKRLRGNTDEIAPAETNPRLEVRNCRREMESDREIVMSTLSNRLKWHPPDDSVLRCSLNTTPKRDQNCC